MGNPRPPVPSIIAASVAHGGRAGRPLLRCARPARHDQPPASRWPTWNVKRWPKSSTLSSGTWAWDYEICQRRGDRSAGQRRYSGVSELDYVVSSRLAVAELDHVAVAYSGQSCRQTYARRLSDRRLLWWHVDITSSVPPY